MSAIPSEDWGDLYTEYQAKIYTYIKRRVTDPTIAEDMTSDVFAKAVEATQRGIGSQSHFGGWLHRIAHNLVIDHYRTRDLTPESVELDAMRDDEDRGNNNSEVLAASEPTPLEAIEAGELRAMIDKAINQLAEGQSTVMNLQLEGYDFDEIADQIGKNKGATKAIAQRSWISLYTRLSEYMGVTGERDTKPVSAVEDMCQLLLDRGPLTQFEMTCALHVKKGKIASALSLHKERFVCVRETETRQGGTNAKVWGLVGIHDREAA
jgi:RNA polymerase sigma factor (sigma-70 family)